MAGLTRREDKIQLSPEERVVLLGQAEVHASMAELEITALQQIVQRLGLSIQPLELQRKNMIQLMLYYHQLQKEAQT